MSNRSTVWTLLMAVTMVLSVACAGATRPPTSSATRPAAQSAAPPEERLSAPATSEAVPEQTAKKSALSNTLRWQTASEVDNFGFDVYRSDHEEGPFVRLTETPIPGSGTSDVPTKYEFSDDSIEPNKAYYYYVESISIGGERERFTPVFRSKPKSLDPPV